MKNAQLLLIALLLAPLAALHANAERSDRVFNVRAFGAAGDGVTLDTQSVQAAIAACHASGGGIVEVPQGNYHAGTLEMLSNVTLKLSDGARLLGSQRLGDYAGEAGGLAEEPAFQKCLIHAENASNLGFAGAGTIDGRGDMTAFPVKRPPAAVFEHRRAVLPAQQQDRRFHVFPGPDSSSFKAHRASRRGSPTTSGCRTTMRFSRDRTAAGMRWASRIPSHSATSRAAVRQGRA